MEKIAFRMNLYPEKKDEYRRRHAEIWPELKELLHAAGVRDYTIFLDEETSALFAVLKLTPNHTMSQLSASPIMQRWWDYMADLMETEPSNAPVTKPLEELFHMD